MLKIRQSSSVLEAAKSVHPMKLVRAVLGTIVLLATSFPKLRYSGGFSPNCQRNVYLR